MSEYPLIPRGEVPAWLRDAAEETAATAARDLGLGEITIRWRRSPPGAAKLGWVEHLDEGLTTEINLSADRLAAYGPRDVKFLVAHEARHIWQRRTSRFTNREADELDASKYARWLTGFLSDVILEPWNY